MQELNKEEYTTINQSIKRNEILYHTNFLIIEPLLFERSIYKITDKPENLDDLSFDKHLKVTNYKINKYNQKNYFITCAENIYKVQCNSNYLTVKCINQTIMQKMFNLFKKEKNELDSKTYINNIKYVSYTNDDRNSELGDEKLELEHFINKDIHYFLMENAIYIDPVYVFTPSIFQASFKTEMNTLNCLLIESLNFCFSKIEHEVPTLKQSVMDYRKNKCHLKQECELASGECKKCFYGLKRFLYTANDAKVKWDTLSNNIIDCFLSALNNSNICVLMNLRRVNEFGRKKDDYNAFTIILQKILKAHNYNSYNNDNDDYECYKTILCITRKFIQLTMQRNHCFSMEYDKNKNFIIKKPI